MKNNLKVEKALEQILTEIKKMSPEEYVKKILCLNGSMTTELFDKVILIITKKNKINQEDFHYFPERYNITLIEFMDVFNYIEKAIGIEVIPAMFETYEAFFSFQGDSFEWSLILGQGSSCTLSVVDYNIKYPEIIIDPKIKFYKRLK